MRLFLASSFALSLVAASPISSRDSAATATTYDYVIVGGGTCGLVVANRLSENQNISVLVVEAGDSVFNNADVTDPNSYGKALGTAIDWQYPIVAQKYSGNSKHTARAGKAVGGTTIDTIANVREDAARAYYWPFTSRTNLQLMVNTVATKIVWAASNGSNATVSGVQVTKADGTTQTINARKEVIISAGSLRSPQLLELSGVGNPDVLSKFGITVKVPLPGVGENLQDQMNNGLSYAGSSSTTYTGIGGYVGYINATDVFGTSTSSVAATVLSALPQYASTVAAASNNVSTAANLQAIFKIQHGLIFNSMVPIAEVLVYPSGTSFGSQYWALLPFARGNVHINSSSPTTAPIINPNYYMLDWDAQGQTGVAKFIRKLFSTAPLNKLVSKETSPGLTTVPASASDATWTKWLKLTFRANYHFVSTAAMMPKASGGVVNPRLVVYGTTNVRVVDASVLPYQLCGHLMSTLYAVAERASDLIKADDA